MEGGYTRVCIGLIWWFSRREYLQPIVLGTDFGCREEEVVDTTGVGWRMWVSGIWRGIRDGKYDGKGF